MERKILIVEDDQVVADTTGLIFNKSGFHCRVTYSAAQALAAVEEFCPTLLLCDVSLLRENGLEAISAITGRCTACRVLLLTGRYSNLGAAQEWASSYQFPVRILTKPLAPALLLQEVDALLQA